MKKKEFNKYIKDTFQFDLKKEKIIYMNLCKDNLRKNQKKLLSEDISFTRYKDWKEYIENKYSVYDAQSLIEFEKTINLILMDSMEFNEYNQKILIALVSVLFTSTISRVIDDIDQNKNIVFLYTLMIIVPIFFVYFLCKIYDDYRDGGKAIPFLRDVKDIINGLIKEKM